MIKKFICGAIFLLALQSCETQTTVFEKKYDGPIIVITNVVTYYSDSARIKIKLTAPLQQEFENGDRLFPNGIFIEFFKKDQTISSTLKANHGKFIKESTKYIVTGNVIIESAEEKKTLNTEELNWEPNYYKIYTDKFVRIQTPEEILTGVGMTASQDFKSYKILKPTGIFSIKGS